MQQSHRDRGRGAILVALALACLLSVGRSSTVAAGAQDPQEPQPRFRTTVVRGALEVVVERDGEFVEGLTAADFEVKVAGETRPIRRVGLVIERPMPGSRPGGSIEVPEADRGRTGTSERESPRRPDGARRRILLLVVDSPALGGRATEMMKSRDRLAGALEGFVEAALAGTGTDPVDAVAIYLLDHASRLQILLPPSRNRTRIDAALQELRELRPWGPLYGFPNRQIRILGALGELTALLSRHAPGSALAFVAAGFDITGARFGDEAPRTSETPGGASSPGGRIDAVSGSGGTIVVDSRVARPLKRFLERARRAAVSVYPIVPTLLADRRRISVTDDSLVEIDTLQDLRHDLHQSQRDASAFTALYAFADATGGNVYRHLPDLEAVLQNVAADYSRYYLLTYEPSPEDTVTARPEVKTLRAGLDIRYRLHLSR